MSTDPGRLGPLLARGSRADVHEWNTGEQDHVVVKIYRGDDQRRSAFALGAALAVTEHPHLLRLAGLVEVSNGLVGVLLPRLSASSAAAWLAARRVISAGECVTLLAPILLALLHLERCRLDARVALSAAIGLDDVLFDERGAAVVTGVRIVPATSSRDPPAAGSSAAGVVSAPEVSAVPRVSGAPSEAARRLAAEVLEATVGGSASARATLRALCEQGASIDELLEVLFDLDEAVPLEWPAPEGAVVAAESEPVLAPAVAPHVLDGIVPGLFAVRAAIAASPRLVGVVRGLGEVRPRVWAAVGVLAVSAVVGLSVLAGPGPEGEPSAGRSPPGSISAAVGGADVGSAAEPGPDQAPASGSGAGSGAGSASDAGTPSGASPSSTSPSSPALSPTSQTEALLTGDDADGAARELLRLRAACLSALDRRCLAAVDQPGSPVLALDVAGVDDPARLAGYPVDLRITEVANRLGGAVLYRARDPDDAPATVLVTRTPDGWRLRAIV